MFRKTKTCDESRLFVLLNGVEGSAAFDEAAEHVEGCEPCQASLTSLAAAKDEWSAVRQFLKPRRGEDDSPASDVMKADFTLEENGRSLDAVDADAFDFLAPPRHPEMLGRLGRYEIERHIGSGGMGIVFKAHDSELNRPVAIKVLPPHLASNHAARLRFAREAKAAAAIVHENVVAIHNVSSSGKLPYFVMQYVAGRSLQERVDADGPLEAKEVLRIGIQVCAGLAAAHQQGLVHRDVKPCNILLENGVERVLLTDFGLARAVDDATVTRSGVVAGTPDYMSPEQANAEPIDQRSDLFSLGSVLYFMCTGHPPFRADRAMAVLKRICHSRPREVTDVNPDIPYELSTIIDKLLSKKGHDRFPNAEKLQAALTDMLRKLQQGRLSARRSRLARLTRCISLWRRSTAAAFLIGAVAVGLAVAFWGGTDGQTAPSSAEQQAQLAQLQAAGALEQLDRVRAEQEAAASQTTPSDSNDVTEEHLRRVWLDMTGVPLGADSNSHSALAELSADLDRQGIAHCESGELNKARKSFEKSLQIRQQLARTAPVSNSLSVQLGQSYYNLGHLERTERNADAASENLQKACSLLEQCLQVDPTNVSALAALADTYRDLGSIDAARRNRGSASRYRAKRQVLEERLAGLTQNGTQRQPTRQPSPVDDTPELESVLLVPNTIAEHGYFMRSGFLFQTGERGQQARPTDIVRVFVRFGRLPGTSIEDLKRIGSISLVVEDDAVQFHVPVQWKRDPVANRASIHGRFSAPRNLVPKMQLTFVGESNDGRKTYIADVKDFIDAPLATSNREGQAPQDVALGERGESIHIHMARSVDSKLVALLVTEVLDRPRFEIEIRHGETGRLVRRIKAPGSAVSTAFSTDGSHIEVKLVDGTFQAFDASTGVQLNSKGQRESIEDEGDGTLGPVDESAVTPEPLSGANEKPGKQFGGLEEEASVSSRKESPFDVIRRRDLRRLHHVVDSIDTRYQLRITGKDGEMAIRAGETKLVELPKPTRQVQWRSGDYKPETIDDTELFDFILVQWNEDGRVTWIKYQSEQAHRLSQSKQAREAVMKQVQLKSAEPGLPLNANGQRSSTEEQGDGTITPTDESAVAPKVSPVFYVILGVDRSVVHLARSVSFEPQATVVRTLDGHTKSIPRAEVASVHVFSPVEPEAIDVIVLKNGEVQVGELLEANETNAVLRKPRGVEDGRPKFGRAEVPQPRPGISSLEEEAGSQSLTIPNYEILHILDNDSRQVAAKDASGQAAAPKRQPMPADRNDLGDEGYGGFEEERRQGNSSSLNNDEAGNSEKNGSATYQEESLALPPRRWAPRNPPIYVVRTHEGDIVVARSLELDAGSNVARLLDGTTKRIQNDAVGSVHLFRQTGPEAVDVIVLKDGSVNLGELFDSNTRQIMLRGMDERKVGRRGGSPWKAFSRNDIRHVVDNATRFHDKYGGDDPSGL